MLMFAALFHSFNFYYKVVAFLFLAVSFPDIWLDENVDDDDDDDELFFFYHSLMVTFRKTNMVFLKLCQILDIYSTRPRDLLTQFGNFPRE